MRYTFKTKESREQHRLASSKGGATLRKKCKEKYEQSPHICITCGGIIPYEKRMNQFCSSSCSAIYNNKHKEKKIRPLCINCHINPVKRNASKFCGFKCQNDYIQKQFIIDWKSGKNNGNYNGLTEKISHRIRHYLFEKYDNKCAECGWGEMNPYSKRIPLEVEHIDGNYMNNKEENLTLLCPNCHSLTPTAKGANRGNGRYYRRLRYKKERADLV